MIVITVAVVDHGTWRVRVADLEGKEVRHLDATRMGGIYSDPATAWHTVGWLVRKEPEQTAIVRYADERSRADVIDATIRGAKEN